MLTMITAAAPAACAERRPVHPWALAPEGDHDVTGGHVGIVLFTAAEPDLPVLRRPARRAGR